MLVPPFVEVLIDFIGVLLILTCLIFSSRIDFAYETQIHIPETILTCQDTHNSLTKWNY